MENPYFENFVDFPICVWKWDESAACGQAHLWQPNGPQCTKSHAVWQSPSSRTIFLFSTLFYFLRFLRCWPYFVAGILSDDFGRNKKAKLNVGLMKNPYFENLADLWHIWPYSQEEGHIHTCSPARLQGHLWVIPTIESCFYGLLRLFSVFVSGLLPHTKSKTPPNTVF